MRNGLRFAAMALLFTSSALQAQTQPAEAPGNNTVKQNPYTPEEPPQAAVRGEVLWAGLQELPPEKRAIFTQIMNDALQRNEVRMKQLKSIRKEMIAILDAEVFNAEAYAAKARDYQGLRADLYLKTEAALVTAAQKLTPIERKLLVRALRRQDAEALQRIYCTPKQ